MRSLFKRFWTAVNRIEIHFRYVSDMSRSTKTLKGIQVPGSNSFKNTLKEPGGQLVEAYSKWRLNFVKVQLWCRKQLAFAACFLRAIIKACSQRWTIIGKFKHLQKQKTQDIQLEESQKLWTLKFESTTCGLQVPHPYGWFWPSARKRNL